MATLLDTSGDRLDWQFRQGEQRTFSVTVQDSNGTTLTNISSARVAFFTGTIASPTAAHSSVSITCTVTANTTISFTVTSTHTRTFTVGSDYCWVAEVTYSDGTIESLWAGDIRGLTEIA